MSKYVRTNPNMPSGWQNQIAFFAEMPYSEIRHDSVFGLEYGRHLAQHYLLGSFKKLPENHVTEGLDKEAMYPDWTPADHLGLVTYGMSQLSFVRSAARREFVIAQFLRDVTYTLGNVEAPDPDSIVYRARLR